MGSAPAAWEPRRELARLYKQAERWKACVEILKEAVEKASWSTPEAKVPLLLEMVEIYRERLKLDVNVIDSYNRILAIQPGNVGRRTPSSRSSNAANPRWPDIIRFCARRPRSSSCRTRRWPCNCASPGSTSKNSRTRPKPSNASRPSWRSIRPIPRPSPSSSKCTRSGATGSGSLAVLRQEVARIVDPTRTGAAVGRGRQARHREAEEGRRLHRAVEQGARSTTSDAEALGELEKLYEREKRWEELARILHKQVALTEEPGKRGVLPKLAILYTEKLHKLDMAIAAWKALLDIEPDNRRAQDALRSCTCRARTGTRSRGSIRRRTNGTSSFACLNVRANPRTTPRASACGTRSRALPRSPGQGREGAEGLREDPVARFRQYLHRRRGADPDLRKGQGRTQAGRGAASAAAPHHRSRLRGERMQRIASSSKPRRKRSLGRLAVALQATREPGGDWALEAGQRLAGETGEWASWSRCTRRRCLGWRGAPRLPLLATLARAYEKELANYPLAIERNKQVLAIEPSDEQAVLGLERLYVATGQHEELLAIYDKKLSLAGATRKSAPFACSSRCFTRSRFATWARRSQLYRDILKTDPDDLQALRALGRLYQRAEKWEELAEIIERQLALAERRRAPPI